VPNFFEDEDGATRYRRADGTSFPVHPGSDIFRMVPEGEQGAQPSPEPEPWGEDPATDMPDAGLLAEQPIDPYADRDINIGGHTIPKDAINPPGANPNEGKPIDPYPELTPEEKMLVAQKREEDALRERGKLAEQRQKALIDGAKESIKKQEEQDAGYEAMWNEARAKWQEQSLEYQKKVDEFRQMRIDPKKLFKDAGTAGTLMMVAGAMLGAYDQPLSGKNPALEIIERAIDREMKAQEANMNKARVALGMDFNLMAHNKKADQDALVYKAQTARMIRQTFADKIKAMAMEQPAEVRARYEQTAAQLEARNAATLQQIGRQKIADNIRGEQLELQKHADRRASIGLGHKMKMDRDAMALRKQRLAQNWYRLKTSRMGKLKSSGSPMKRVSRRDIPQKRWQKFGIRHPVTGKDMGVIDIGNDTEAKGVRSAIQNYHQLGQLTRRMIRQARSYGRSYDGPMKDYLRSAEGKKLWATWSKIINLTVKARTGAQASAMEMERIVAEWTKPQSTVSIADATKIWEQGLLDIAKKMDGYLASHVTQFEESKGYSFISEFSRGMEESGGIKKQDEDFLRKKLTTADRTTSVTEAAIDIARRANVIDNTGSVMLDLQRKKKELMKRGVRRGGGLATGKLDDIDNPIDAIEEAQRRLLRRKRQKGEPVGHGPIADRVRKARKKAQGKKAFREATQKTLKRTFDYSRRRARDSDSAPADD
jgi:hypothetical protein